MNTHLWRYHWSAGNQQYIIICDICKINSEEIYNMFKDVHRKLANMHNDNDFKFLNRGKEKYLKLLNKLHPCWSDDLLNIRDIIE